MKEILFKSNRFRVLVVIIIFLVGVSTPFRSDAKPLKHRSYGANYVINVGNTLNLKSKRAGVDAISFKSDNPKVAEVKNGVVKAKKGGVAVITIRYKNKTEKNIEIGVKSTSYIPNKKSSYKVGKAIPAGEYVVFRDDRTVGRLYISIYSKDGKRDSSMTAGYSCFVKLEAGESFSFSGGYAVPLKKVKKNCFRISKINKQLKILSKRSAEWGFTFIKVGFVIEPGVYEFIPIESQTGEVIIFNKNNTMEKADRVAYKREKKTFKMILKKGQHVGIRNCKFGKVEEERVSEL